MTKEKYLEILNQNLNLDTSSWFDAANTEVVEDNFIYSGEAALAIVEQGETFWECPGWVADLYRTFRYDWRSPNMTIRARLTAEWLLNTMPSDPIDTEFIGFLRYVAEGNFVAVFEGSDCIYPRKPEYYLKTLQWQMVGLAREVYGSLERVSR